MIKLSISAAPHNQLMKSAVMAAVLLSSAGVVLGQTTTNLSFTVNQNIPQGDPSGFANTQTRLPVRRLPAVWSAASFASRNG